MKLTLSYTCCYMYEMHVYLEDSTLNSETANEATFKNIELHLSLSCKRERKTHIGRLDLLILSSVYSTNVLRDFF